MNEMYQLLDDLNLAKVRLDECDDESFVRQLNNAAYLRAMTKVEERGRLFFGDDSLTSDEIENKILTQLSEKAKTFLNQDVDSMVEVMGELDEDTSTALICMENVVNAKNDPDSDFYYSSLFRVGRDFFKKFSALEVAKFETLSSVLAGTSENKENKGVAK